MSTVKPSKDRRGDADRRKSDSQARRSYLTLAEFLDELEGTQVHVLSVEGPGTGAPHLQAAQRAAAHPSHGLRRLDGQPRGAAGGMTTYDVRVWAIREYKGKDRKTGKARSTYRVR